MAYWAYARVSTHKQAHGKTIDEQIRPLKKYLYNHGYHTANSIRTHLFHEQYTGTTMKRPKFQQMMKHVHKGDTLVFAKLSRMSRTLDGADKFIMKTCKPNDIKVHILDGGWNIDPTTAMGRLQMHLFLSFVEFDHDLVIGRMNEGRRQAKLNGKKNWNGGIAPRFYGKKKKHYQQVYKYTFNHSEQETATTFDISRRTVDRIKKAGREYYSAHNKNNPN